MGRGFPLLGIPAKITNLGQTAPWGVFVGRCIAVFQFFQSEDASSVGRNEEIV